MSRTVGGRAREAVPRCLTLYFYLDAAHTPRSTDEIIHNAEIYPPVNAQTGEPYHDDTLSKSFERDRKRLETAGIFICEANLGGAKNERALWQIDRTRTYTSGIRKLPTSTIEQVLGELKTYAGNPLWASNSAFSELWGKFTNELIRRGDESFIKALGDMPELASDPDITRLWNLFKQRHRMRITYLDAAGQKKNHLVDAYGFYLLNNTMYLVANVHGDADEAPRLRTFRADRIQRVREYKQGQNPVVYQIPKSFRVQEHVYLPFDVSPDANGPTQARFSFAPGIPLAELESITHGRGALERSREDDTWTWSIEVNNLEGAASFALVNTPVGMRPRSPEALVAAWRGLIGKAVETHG